MTWVKATDRLPASGRRVLVAIGSASAWCMSCSSNLTRPREDEWWWDGELPPPPGEEPEVPHVDWQAACFELAELFDALEAAVDAGEVERVQQLFAGRFEMMEKRGIRVEFTSMPVSDSKH